MNFPRPGGRLFQGHRENFPILFGRSFCTMPEKRGTTSIGNVFCCKIKLNSDEIGSFLEHPIFLLVMEGTPTDYQFYRQYKKNLANR